MLPPPGGLNLNATSVETVGDTTTMRFTRSLADGRFPFIPSAAAMNFAYGEVSGGGTPLQHCSTCQYFDMETVNLTLAAPAPGSVPTVDAAGAASPAFVAPHDKRDGWWVAHGVLAVLTWAFIAPYAVTFARCVSRDAQRMHAAALLTTAIRHAGSRRSGER